MDYYSITTILIVLSALFGYINVRFLKLPTTIGLMVITLLFTLAVVILSYFDDTLLIREKELILSIDFQTVLLDIMLSFLLFAGAWICGDTGNASVSLVKDIFKTNDLNLIKIDKII